MPKAHKFPRESFTIPSNGHIYYITHMFATKTPVRTNNLWFVSRDTKDIAKAKLFRTKADIGKCYGTTQTLKLNTISLKERENMMNMTIYN